MSQKTLKNKDLEVVVDSFGAEIQSVKSPDGTEYMWQGDEKYWGRRAPVLFPVVGRLRNGRYHYDGVEYNMGSHGFARDMEFKLEHHLPHELVYELREDEESLAHYPFKFLLKIIYRLEKNVLTVKYEVKNLDEKVMFFSIGAHPAFNLPLTNGVNFDDYKITISPNEERQMIPLNTEFGTAEIDQIKKVNMSEIPVNRDLFKVDTLIFETPDATSVELSTDKDARKVTVAYEDMPFLGIWSPYKKDAPFVCIEPWCGVSDDDESDGDLKTKYGINELMPDQKFECKYTIKFD